MVDYAHPLTFGAFLAPTADPPQRPVELALLCEDLGLDVVGFQDHPYEPRLQDCWTLLAVVAARTTRIRLATDVLSVPLRPPAVMARAAASLDRLCGGRVELGLGAGGYPDGIAGMGGLRLTAGQSIAALAEAVQVLRGLWATDDDSPFTFHGEHYQVENTRRGPAPAHRIPIGIGAHRPRMLRLTGEVADTWMPTLPYLPGGLESLSEVSKLVDEGAASVGREPAEVTRVLNFPARFSPTTRGSLDGPPDHWAEQLSAVALETGISGFLLMSDSPADITRFAEEVVPRTREIVHAARAAG